MFVIDTDYDKDSENIAKYVNKICEKFKNLGIKSVLFSYYDINANGPLTLNGVKKNFIYFFQMKYNKKDVVIFPNKSKKGVFYKDSLTV